MSRSWILAIPTVLTLLVAGCATNAPTNEISPTSGVGTGIGNTPGMPVSPNTPPEISGSLTNTEALSTPASTTSRQRVRRSRVDNRGGFGGAAGRAPTNSSGQMQSPGS